jgi:hypothetical protein
VAARLCRPGGVRALIAENLLLKQQLIVLHRARRRAPNLTRSDRLLCGFESLFLTPGRIRKLAIVLRPATLLAFHQALVHRKYRRLFSSRPCSKKPGPKGPDQAVIQAIIELKSRNPRFGCPQRSVERVPVAIEFPPSRGVEQRALAVITSLRSQDLARPLYFRPCLATTQSALLEPTPWERIP